MTENNKVQRWADPAMFAAETLGAEGVELKPTVTVTSMTANPLRVIGAVARTYQGRMCSDPSEITRAEATRYLVDIRRGKLKAPLEWVQVALMFHGVSRDFTHQLVRQRTATYAQESMRFAVKEDAAYAVPTPPSILLMDEDDPFRVAWREHVKRTADLYLMFVNSGRVPAEDARKALLIGTGTSVQYRTNLRDLMEHAGMRLCSQAQYEWKVVWEQIVKALLAYGPHEERWQQRAIVSLFAPICYQTGKCEFMASTDRWCVIRDRVEAHHVKGEAPSQWHDIDPYEPLARLAATDLRRK